MDRVVSLMINFRMQILSLGTDIQACKSECSMLKGHLPYTFEGQESLEVDQDRIFDGGAQIDPRRS